MTDRASLAVKARPLAEAVDGLATQPLWLIIEQVIADLKAGLLAELDNQK